MAVLLLIIMVIFSACEKKQEYLELQISKNGDLTLESLYTLANKYNILDRNDLSRILKIDYQYEGNINQEALMNTYRLGVHFRDDTARDEKKDKYSSVWGIVLEPCNSSIEYDDYEKYPIHNRTSSKPVTYISEPLYSGYFKIEDLEKIGYIAQERDKQQDLCVFIKHKVGGMGYERRIYSNKLIYTAEEINAVMDEYEALK